MRERYFIAIIPDEPLFTILQKLKEEAMVLSGSKAALSSPPHITLHMPFLFDKLNEKKLIDTIANTILKVKKFQIKLCDFYFFGERVIYMNVINSEQLLLTQQVVVNCMKNLQIFNQSESTLGFHPHITIAFRDLKREMFRVLWSVFQSRKFEFDLLVNSICLLRYESRKWEVIHKFNFDESI